MVTDVNNLSKLKPLVLILIALTVVQVILGTQVRQEVERISILLNYSERSTWIERLSPVFYVHRSFSILILIAHCFFVYQVNKSIKENNILSKMSVVLLGILIIEIMAGIILNYLDVPAFIQPVHMLLGSVLMGLQFFILFIINFSSKKVRQAIV
jgi:cytochrome c oxidase assembly protein subunit 15